MKKIFVSFAIIFLALIYACENPAPSNSSNQYINWSTYLGNNASSQQSPITSLSKENISALQPIWIYESGAIDSNNRSQIQCNPLVIDGVLYGTNPVLSAFALDAKTGKKLWTFDPFDKHFDLHGMGVNRGLHYWADGEDQRIIYAAGSLLWCLNAKTGQPINEFGAGGKVDLHEGLGRDVADLFVVSNTPGVVFEDKVIIGMRVSESMGAAPGHIRAYNVRTGAHEWIFHTIPQPGEYGYDTWPKDAYKTMGGANSWAGMSLDEERGMVFVPTGSAAFDFYGGDRAGENLFANCIIALDANTGKRIWHYQTVHHDLWDRDLPAPPNLLTVTHDGKKIDAVAQITKSAFVFLLDRETGKPLFPVEEVPVPASTLDGETAWPTQPIPSKPPQFARTQITDSDITRRTPEAYQFVKNKLDGYLSGSEYIPPSLEGTLVFPDFDGGGEWGGAANDDQGILYVNASERPCVIQMKPYEKEENNELLAQKGKGIYDVACVSCHGEDLKGASIFTVPSLVDVKRRLQPKAIATLVKNGKGQMPSFSHLGDSDIDAIVAFLYDSKEKITEEKVEAGDESNRVWKYPYVMNGYQRLKDNEGFSPITPPWGTLNAIDLNNGAIKWKVTLGSDPRMDSLGIYDGPTGSPSYGGPVVTANGLLVMAGTMDEKIRIFDTKNGTLLWEHQLPAAGFATPAMYEIDGQPYIVIACGGGKLGQRSGDTYVAFSPIE